MNQRPIVLPLLSTAIAVIIAMIPLQIVMIYGHGFSEVFDIFAKLTLLNWLVILMGAASVVAVARASPLTQVIVPVLIGVVGVNNWFVGFYATDFSPLTANLATVGFAAITLPLLHPSIRLLFKHPERRWWLRADRKRVSIPIFLGGTRSVALRAETFDLSESGAFIPMDTIQENKGLVTRSAPKDLSIQERVSISLSLGMYSQIRCEGRVVRMSGARGNYPAGIGIQFTTMSATERKELKKYLAKHAQNFAQTELQ